MFLRKITFLCVFFGMLFAARFAAANFQMAAQLMNAARARDIFMVERLIQAGADVNFVDQAGMSIICVLIQNNEMQAAQILQRYGADASRCNQQIRRFNENQYQYAESGMFSGLSDAQNLTLIGGGAALGIAGLYYLGGGFGGNGGNNNAGGGGGGGDRPIQGPGGGGPGTGTQTPQERVRVAYGPAQWDFSTNRPSENFNMGEAMNIWSDGANQRDFNLMNNNSAGIQNYMLLMGGYATLARGYLGQLTFRDTAGNGHRPLALADGMGGGGAAIPVALITRSGVNPTGTAMNSVITYARCTNPNDPNCVGTMNRYRNLDANGNEIGGFDFSGAGTVFNSSASAFDSLLAKIIVGGTATGDERADADFIGFMPNGQLALYRTGGGFRLAEGGNLGQIGGVGDDTPVIFSADTIIIDGTTYTRNTDFRIDINGNFIFTDGRTMTASGGNLWLTEQQAYRNFDAMLHALNQVNTGYFAARGGVIANAAIVDSMRGAGTANIGAVTGQGSNTANINEFLRQINLHYHRGETTFDDPTINPLAPGLFFNSLNGVNAPVVIFSAGEFRYGDNALLGQTRNTQTATFENAAPLLYNGLMGTFMTAVAVQYVGATGGGGSASENLTGGQFRLSRYTANGEETRARACGVAGTGTGAVDPWCFSVAAMTGEQAVAGLAGAVGALQGAFGYMTNQQIFHLLALTSDGRYMNQSQLAARYILPTDWASSGMTEAEWMRTFNETFGYGMINLERATRPGERLYFFGNSNRVADGYWSGTPVANRTATAATTVNLSNAFGGVAQHISVPMFDFVEAYNGERMPRAFNSDFQIGGERHGMALMNLMNEISFAGEQSGPIVLRMTEDGLAVQDLKIRFDGEDYAFGAHYRERIGFNTFENDNPIMGIAGRMASGFFEHDFGGGFNHSITFFGGEITDEGLMAHDPSMDGRFLPLALGSVYGFDTSIGFKGLRFGAGYMFEDNTTLGAYSGGLLNFGGGETVYGSAELKIRNITATYTAAHTRTDPTGDGFIMGMSNLYSDAYALNADFGRWSFNVSRPLAITQGRVSYMHTDFELVEMGFGFDLETNSYMRDISLAAGSNRETRLAFLYQPEISERTKMAFGLVTRINPNNMPGIENIGMMKFHHIW